MRQPSRRTFLCAAGLLGTAGCLGRPSDSSGTTSTPTASTPATSTRTTPTSAALGTEQSIGGVPVEVSNLTVQASALYFDSPDSMAVERPDDGRYVFVTVSGSTSGPAPASFSLVVDGDRYTGSADVFGGPVRVADRGPVYDPAYGTDSGWVAFVVPPALDATEARIVVDDEGDTATWRVSETHLDALRRPAARFELRSATLPETIRRGDPVTVRVVAENVSDVSGTFRGVLNVAGLGAAYAPYPFTLDADPGETVTWEKTFDDRPPDGAESIGFYLYTVAGDSERSVPVRGEATGDPATERETTSERTSEATTETTTETETTTLTATATPRGTEPSE